MELPLKPKDLKAQDVPDIIDEALKEAGGLYPVPRYMSVDEIRTIVNGLLAT
jgi:alcohol dehydrogenase